MSDRVAELRAFADREDKAAWVSNLWDKWDNQRATKVAEWIELRNYIFATDTTSTSNQTLPWKNKTTIPKLCQIRDNLHANYESSLFPNDRWLQWVGYDKSSVTREKRETIQAYMENKTRIGRFRTTANLLLLDFIDYGNAFATTAFEQRYKTMPDGTELPDFIGPKMMRISPTDIVFDPTAASFENSPKIIRSIKSLGELKKLAMTNPDESFWEKVISRRMEMSRQFGGYSRSDWSKAIRYQVDGFGSIYEYYMSDYVEILEFYGDYHDAGTGELQINQVITIADRSLVANQVDNPNYGVVPPIRHCGWRERQDNLWSMGPLDNLVGMQYRIDHLENLKADAMDLMVHPPIKVYGEVEQFNWAPMEVIHIDEGGDVQEMGTSLGSVISVNNEIQLLQNQMEEMAGAPRQAAGIRTPGEKTAHEINVLENAAGRIFQAKITKFEVELLEPILNDMLGQAVRNMNGADIIRVKDDDIGVVEFKTVTPQDIMANGQVRPVGARHFAKQAQDLQNLVGVYNGPLGQMIMPHTSAKNMAKFVEDIVGLQAYDVFKENIAIYEQQESQSLMNQAQEELTAQAAVEVPMA